MDSVINSEAYWDNHFLDQQDTAVREEQTRFFMSLVVDNLPAWIAEDIQENHMSVCDAGCASGIGTRILKQAFAESEVSGFDFSQYAVAQAENNCPDCAFFKADIKNLEQTFDVVVCSNVLEHFYDADLLLKKVVGYARKYCILLLPFREFYTIPEHQSYFDFKSFPLEIEDQYELCFFKPMTMNAQQEKYWFGEQILVVYARKEQLASKKRTLRNFYNGYIEERTQIIQYYTEMEHRNTHILSDDYTIMREAARIIDDLQKSRWYKLYIAAKRFKNQILTHHQGKDFFKWVMNVLFRTTYSVRKLCEFDSLMDAKYLLLKQALVHEHIVQGVEAGIPEKYKKKSAQIFIFAGVPLHDVGGGQRCAQLAKIFNQMGFRVHYIYGFPCAESAPADVWITTVTHACVDEINLNWFSDRATEGDLVIFEIPYAGFEEYLDKAKANNCYTIYEHIDNWDTSLGCMFYEKSVFKRFPEKVDLVTVTARMLGDKIQEVSDKPYIYLPNAVNSDLFEPKKKYDCPADLKKGKRTLLYFGSLWGDWFDWDKIEYVARHCPKVTINLIGDDSNCQPQKNRMPSNVYFLGVKKQIDLPAYLQHSDIALLPFKNCDIGKYVSPLKIFEYIAMQVHVLSTSLNDIQNYPNVSCFDTNEEWAQMVNGELPPLVDVSAFIANNNWYARCEQMLIQAGNVRTNYPKVSVIILNRNNMSVIFRCVNTLLSYQERYGYEIIVVDNDSSDGSPQKLEETYGNQIKLLRNGKNGCSSGRNLGAKSAEGEYLCFLDSDQWVVSSRWLDNELDILDSDPSIGAVGWAAGWFLPGQVAGPITDYYPNRGIRNPVRMYRDDIACLGSGGLLVRTNLFREVGGFDEYFDPTCFEDTDFSLKIRDAGYELAYTPYSGIMHLPHQTTKSGSVAHAALMKRNGDYFQSKWKAKNPKLLEYYNEELD